MSYKYAIYLIGLFAMTTLMIMTIIVPIIGTMIMTITKIALNDNDRSSNNSKFEHVVQVSLVLEIRMVILLEYNSVATLKGLRFWEVFIRLAWVERCRKKVALPLKVLASSNAIRTPRRSQVGSSLSNNNCNLSFWSCWLEHFLQENGPPLDLLDTGGRVSWDLGIWFQGFVPL